MSLPIIDGHRLWRGILVLCCTLLTTCSAPAYIDTVLFVVTYNPEHGEVSIEPAVQIAQGRLNQPSVDESFVKSHLSGRVYPLYQQGRLIGQVHTGALTPMGCSALQGNAQLQITVPMVNTGRNYQGNLYLLATSTLLAGPMKTLEPLSDDERETVRRTGLDQLRGLGISEPELRTASLMDVAHFTLDGRPALVGTVSILADAIGVPGATAFLMLEREDNNWKPVYLNRARFKDINGQDFSGQMFRDLIDLDRDGTPELILELMGNEVYQFQILKRQGSDWRPVYTGGGGGC